MTDRFFFFFLLSILWIFIFPLSLYSQSKLTENTLTLDDAHNMPEASIADFEWLAGRWLGEGFGGQMEEFWHPPLGGTMLASFRFVSNDQPGFYELCLLAPEKNTIVYKVKHFHPDFKAWEEKDDYHTFHLIKLEGNTVYFDGLTMIHKGNELIQFLAIEEKDGLFTEHRLVFKKAAN